MQHFWQQLSPQQRQELLSVDLDTLQQRASTLQAPHHGTL
jgi:hypothetical protein